MLILREAASRPSTNSCELAWFCTNTFSCQAVPPGLAGAVSRPDQRQAVPAGTDSTSGPDSWSATASGPVYRTGCAPAGTGSVVICWRSRPGRPAKAASAGVSVQFGYPSEGSGADKDDDGTS